MRIVEFSRALPNQRFHLSALARVCFCSFVCYWRSFLFRSSVVKCQRQVNRMPLSDIMNYGEMKLQKLSLANLAITFSMSWIVLCDCAPMQLSSKQREAFRSIKTVRIIVDQSYSNAYRVTLPFCDVARIIFRHCGIEEKIFDAKYSFGTMTIKAEGRALAAEYYIHLGTDWRGGLDKAIPILGNSVGYRYSGADLSGCISLEVPEVSVYEKAFKGHIEPSSLLERNYSKPSSAPFLKAFLESGSFVTQILEIIGDIYGTKPLISVIKYERNYDLHAKAAFALTKAGESGVEALISLLKYQNSDVRKVAAVALKKTKNDRVVEALIAALKDHDWSVRLNVADALRKITGKDFYQDSAKWQKWWEQNNKKYLKNR